MTNTTQIPASEVERIEREAKEFNIGPRSIMIDSWNEGFDEGYIAGAKSEYLRRERWVSVKERLPEPGIDVLTYMGVEYEDGWEYWVYIDHYHETDECFNQERGMSAKVTHWMPLPSAPEPPSEP